MRFLGGICLFAMLWGGFSAIAGYAQNGKVMQDDHALHSAAIKGDVKLVRELLVRGSKVDSRLGREQFTPLALASIYGRTDVIRVLLEKGAKVDAWVTDGKTPLMFAALWGRTDAVRVLLAAGARRDLTDKSGKTALDYAREGKTPASTKEPHGHIPVIRLLESAHKERKGSRKSSLN